MLHIRSSGLFHSSLNAFCKCYEQNTFLENQLVCLFGWPFNWEDRKDMDYIARADSKQHFENRQFVILKHFPFILLGQILQRRCGSTWPLLVTNMSFLVKLWPVLWCNMCFVVLFPCIVSFFFFSIHSCPGILPLNKALVYEPWSRDVF